jgi:predicted TIM-barrel fold metal-dependent hydrolase
MQIIDTHHHLWAPETDPANIGYVWLKNIGAMKPFGDPTAIQRDYGVDEFCSESVEHELIGSVHVQCDGAIPDPVRESEWLESLQAEHGLPSVHVGFLDLTSGDAQQTLERYVKLPHFRGVRQILSRIDERPEISFVPEHYLRNPLWREQFGLLAEHELSFDLQLYPQQMAEAAEFLAQHADIPVVIDHAGSPDDQSEAGQVKWKQGLALLAELPHCQVKLSGFGMFNAAWDVESTLPLFADMAELFGAERMMWGSNFPVDKLMRPYDFGVRVLLDCAERVGLNQVAVAGIFCDNARAFYRLEKDL